MMWIVLALVFINGDAKLFAAFSAATANRLYNLPSVAVAVSAADFSEERTACPEPESNGRPRRQLPERLTETILSERYFR